ncbi:capsid assembly scaffolding protein Gp46 family protein [Pseudolactococcus reticulitermitis]|uniref:DUF4355 domain-containing protein n=1 Tax=Pseudolactococcus reticulitermitis TaxID=2025039 RepID=A0A224XAM6_9LACT|nr:DUF4355 domain-containing protein [Lactococcus reticulitermitis]GAX46775.1 hypothetical protein RsY01_354 [Lactococcus reticulitermitis]
MLDEKRFKFRLFDEGAEGADGGGTPPEGTGANSGGAEGGISKEEHEKLLQAETDRRVTQALEKSRADNQKAIDAAVADALRQAKLSKEDREAEAQQKAQQAQAQKEAELSKRELTLEAKELLVEKGLNKEFINVLNFESQESMTASIDAISEFVIKEIASGIENGVKKRLADSAINPAGGAKGTATATKESFAKMSYEQKTELYNNNRELYNSLSQQNK